MAITELFISSSINPSGDVCTCTGDIWVEEMKKKDIVLMMGHVLSMASLIPEAFSVKSPGLYNGPDISNRQLKAQRRKQERQLSKRK